MNKTSNSPLGVNRTELHRPEPWEEETMEQWKALIHPGHQFQRLYRGTALQKRWACEDPGISGVDRGRCGDRHDSEQVATRAEKADDRHTKEAFKVLKNWAPTTTWELMRPATELQEKAPKSRVESRGHDTLHRDMELPRRLQSKQTASVQAVGGTGSWRQDGQSRITRMQKELCLCTGSATWRPFRKHLVYESRRIT